MFALLVCRLLVPPRSPSPPEQGPLHQDHPVDGEDGHELEDQGIEDHEEVRGQGHGEELLPGPTEGRVEGGEKAEGDLEWEIQFRYLLETWVEICMLWSLEIFDL